MAKYRILSIDGGGVRGLLVTVLLQQLEMGLPGWRDRTDLLAGTSTGGIIALGLAKGLTPTDLRHLYYDKSPAIFGDSLLDDIRDLGRVVGAEFSNRNLRRELESVFGVTRLQDLGQRVLISSFDLDNEDPDPTKRTWKPKFFHNFPGIDTDGPLRVADVALYTSAAPTYFPSVDGYVDGGVAANNPSMAALAQSLDRRARIPQRPSIDEISLLSIGTGRSLSRITGRRHDWGYAQWAKPLLRLMFDAVSGIPDYQCRQILGDRYHRIDYTFKPGQEIDLAEHAARDRLVKIGEEGMKADVDQALGWLRKNWM
jgi:patatin-like phospholipase/acyl hydrolase